MNPKSSRESIHPCHSAVSFCDETLLRSEFCGSRLLGLPQPVIPVASRICSSKPQKIRQIGVSLVPKHHFEWETWWCGKLSLHKTYTFWTFNESHWLASYSTHLTWNPTPAAEHQNWGPQNPQRKSYINKPAWLRTGQDVYAKASGVYPARRP